MNICRMFFFAAFFTSCLAYSGSAAIPPTGIWVLPTGVACAMSFELTDDGRVVRTTGELVYTTTASLIPDGRGWLLDEKLQSNNDKKSCRGEVASEVAEHLKNKAYIEVKGEQLHYHHTKGRGKPLYFIRLNRNVSAP